MSSDCDRCMKSAETNLASFFAPAPQWQFDKHLSWQPISIYYTPKEDDKVKMSLESYYNETWLRSFPRD